MVVGHILIGLAFVTAVVSALGYGFYYKNPEETKLNLANKSYYILFASLLLASILLMSQLLTHNYQLNYVYSYSSNSLSTFYLISTFWAGQEGTFLLWLLLGVTFGLFLIKNHAKNNPLVMVYLIMVNLFLLIILIKKSPFSMIWDVQNAPFGFKPADGSGLNPLLQNPWMVIHPPTLFVGYASTVVPFAFAMSALVRKDFQSWIKDARPWVIFTVLSLGAGIMLGAYWAYITLGWGGYWGWDPVENSSLIPWLLSVALLHGIIIQNRQKGLVRTNFFLAGLSFIAMLWGSFLTRSGVLTDFSVHSFGESGVNSYLMAFMGLFAALFAYYYYKSSHLIKTAKFSEGLFSREMFTLIGILTVLFSAIFTFFGTSSPIFTGMLGNPSNVSLNYYNTIHIPITFFLLLSLGIVPILAWKVSEFRNKSTLIISAIVSLFITVFAIIVGLNQFVSVVLFFLSVFAIVMNASVVYKMALNNPKNIGGSLTHVGMGLMIIGILTSSVYDISEKIVLPKGEFQSSGLGYDVKFMGFRDMPDGKNRAQLQVKFDEKVFPAEAQFYYSEFTKSYMVSPYVKFGLSKDIYISPVSFTPAKQSNTHEVILKKGETKEVHNFNISFHSFEMGGSHADPSASMVITANLTIEPADGSSTEPIKMKPEYIMKNGGFIAPELQIPNYDAFIKLGQINASEGAIKLQLISNDKSKDVSVDMLGIEISKKPFIIVLWFGTIVALAGIFVSFLYQSKKK